MVDDIRGHAILAALEESPRVLTTTAGDGVAPRLDEVNGLLKRVQERLDDRLVAYRLSFHRIRGLAGVVGALAADATVWWADGSWSEPVEKLRNFAEMLASRYRLETLARIEREAQLLDGDCVRAFIDGLPGAIEAHRGRIEELSATRPLDAERIANARAAAHDPGTTTRRPPSFRYWAAGPKAWALTDGEHVFKVFDYWKPRNSVARTHFPRRNRGIVERRTLPLPDSRVPRVGAPRGAGLFLRTK